MRARVKNYFVLGILVLASFIILPVALRAYTAFFGSAEAKEADSKTSVAKNSFILDLDGIFKDSPNFSYSSKLTLTIGHGEAHRENHEEIHIVGSEPRIHFKKKLDDFHFFEIFKDDDHFLVKNLNGPWRKGTDKSFYNNLLEDGMNIVDYIIDEFSLKEQLRERQSVGHGPTFVVEKGYVAPEAPFLKKIKETGLQSFLLKDSSVNVRLAMDSKNQYVIAADFNMLLNAASGHWLKLKAIVALETNTSQKTLDLPVAENETEIIYPPVNVARRFNELMGAEKGIKPNEK